MGKRALRTAFGGALAAMLASGLALASSPFTVFDIPGVSGKRIEVGGVSRLSDGGGIVAAAIAGRALAVRLSADGTVDLAYGAEGIARPPLGADLRATALAIDPANGDAWIGFAAGEHGRSEIVALDGHGRLLRRFGRAGVLHLGAGSPTALAWRGNRLLVAAGTRPCAGCVISVLNSTTGRLIHESRLDATYTSGKRTCTIAGVTSATFGLASGATLGTRAASDRCTGELIVYSPPQPPGTVPVLAPRPSPVVDVAGTCTAVSGPSGTVIGSARAPRGQIVSVVALDDGACAALIIPKGYPAAMVLQAPSGQREANSYAIPTGISPLGMFRCHQHLLVIGKRGRTGVVVVVPVTAGPHAAAAETAAAGCTT